MTEAFYHEGAGHFETWKEMGSPLYDDFMRDYRSQWFRHEVHAQCAAMVARDGGEITPGVVSEVKNAYLPNHPGPTGGAPVPPDYYRSPGIWEDGELCPSCKFRRYTPPEGSTERGAQEDLSH
jgi:hypothetical protein